MISISNLRFCYPHSEFRLTVPEFAIASGEKIAVVGPSGSGKTTLLNLLAGILTPNHGRVRVGAFDVSDLGDAGRRDFRISKRAIHLAEQMGIAEHLKKHPGELSQGEKQRAAICRALLPNPSLILADEATGNLDPTNKNRILDLLFESVADHDATLVAVTHDHELLPRFDRVVDFSEFQQGDRSKESGAEGPEQGDWSKESGAGKPELGDRSKESGAGKPELGDRSKESGAKASKIQAPDSGLQAPSTKLQTPSSPLPAPR